MPKEKNLSPEDKMGNTARAAALRHELQAIFDERRDSIIKKLIGEYRRGQGLHHDNVVGAVAELSAMAGMMDKLTREISQSEDEVLE